jgi:predicted MFS family arabinose efflux permease
MQETMQPNIRRYYLYNFFLNFQLWWPIWIIYLKEERGLSQTQVTLIDVPFWLSIVLLQIPGAALADRWGRRPALIASGACFALAITLFGLASSFPLLLLSYLVWGVAFSLFNGTESAFIYDTLKGMGRENEYQLIYGRTWALNMVAAIAGTLIGAPLADATSLSFPIVLSGAIAGLAALTALTFREPARGEGPISHLSYPDVLRQSAQIVRRQASVRYAILFVGVVAIGSIGPIFFFQPFLVDHGVSTGEVGLWQTPMRIAAIFGALAAHRITRELGERGTFYLMPVVLVSSYLLLAIWGSLYAQVAFLSLYFVMVLSQPVLTDYVNRRVPSEQRATVVSLTNLVRALVLIPSAPLMGLLADDVSSTAPFWAGAVLVVALSLPLLVLWAPFMRREARAEPALAEAAGAASGD